MGIISKTPGLKQAVQSVSKRAARRCANQTDVLLIVSLSVCAYIGALRLGLAYDDYYNLWVQQAHPLVTHLGDPEWNRFPIFAFAVYPALLSFPHWLAHVTILSVHTLSAVLVYRILNHVHPSRMVSLLAAILFLAWPAHAEALHWLVASTVIFGVCCVLGSVLLFFSKRYVAATILACVGYTFSEGIFFPGLYLHAVATLRSQLGWRLRALYLGAHCLAYAGFQALRMLISGPNVTHSQMGLVPHTILKNAAHLVFMTLGVASSRDVVWMWLPATQVSRALNDVTQPLSWPFLGLALAAGGLFTSALIRSHRDDARRLLSLPGTIGSLAISLAGYVSGFVIFLPITNNAMNTRYTYTAVSYLCVILATGIAVLVYHHKAAVRVSGRLLVAFVIGWALFQAWSNVEANWYPAWQVSQRIQEDVRLTYLETGIARIHLVNDAKAVGNGYALGRDWAYRGMAKFFISPDLELTADEAPALVVYATAPERQNQAVSKEIQQGLLRFSETPCLFVGWHEGERVVTTLAFSRDREFLLNCETGLVELPRLVEGSYLEYLYPYQFGQGFLNDLGLGS